eukprot:Mycagemm_TRINITY_DN9985_c0_g1::TRINITY_DN9985_c0_g1_i1::g.3334::m.3334 type:complete len:168 gc:universal TRINITY_DN9985_c0_g1_i1:532-29(-)
MSDDDELGLLLLNESGDVIQTELDDSGGLGLDNSLGVLSLGLSSLEKASLLLSLALWLVLVQELEESGGVVLVQSAGELGNGRRHLQALVQDALLALQANVLGPAQETGKIALRLEIATDAKVTRAALEKVSGDDPLGLGRSLGRSLGSGLGRGLLGSAGHAELRRP